MRIRALLAAATLLVAIAACQPTPAAPLLTDPRDILGRTIGSTSAIRSVHARAEISIRNAVPVGQPEQPVNQGGTAEAVVDLAAGEISVSGAAADGTGRFAMIVADGASFSQSSLDAGRWIRMPIAGGLGPGAVLGMPVVAKPPDLPALLTEALADPTTTIELRGVEDCATGRCYRVAVGLTAERVFDLFIALSGMDQMPGFDEEMLAAGGFLPALGIEVVSDTASLRLTELAVSASMQGTAIALRVQLARFDEPVSIQAPPPALVDDFDQITDEILEDVGRELERPSP
jgi:hypothetical protein